MFLVKYSSPIYLFKQLCNDINRCSTHQEALNSLDLIEVLISIIDEDKFQLEIENDQEEIKKLINDDYDIEFYTKNSLSYYFNRFKCDWHLALNRFTSILPSNKSRMDQLLYSSSFRTISKMLYLQTKLFDNTKINLNCSQENQVSLVNQASSNEASDSIIDKWLFNMIYSPASSLLTMIKNLLINYETDETRIK